MIPEAFPIRTDLPDEAKFLIVVELVKSMSDEFKNKVIEQIAEGNVTGETQVKVMSNEQFVRIDFGKPLAWFAIPKAHALQLGASLMQHAGAVIQKVDREPSA